MASGSPHAGAALLSSKPFDGRLVYNIILFRVVETSFRHLDRDESKALGTVIGSCARIMQEISEDHDASASTKRASASYRKGLITTLHDWLPELRHLQGRTEGQLQLTVEDAGSVYTKQFQHFKTKCSCDFYCPSAKSKSKKSALEGYCLSFLMETIIALGLLLSNIVVATAIFPTRFGLQQYYLHQAQKRLTATVEDISGPQLLPDAVFECQILRDWCKLRESFPKIRTDKGSASQSGRTGTRGHLRIPHEEAREK